MPNDNLEVFAKLIEATKQGREGGDEALRLLLSRWSRSMPVPLLIELSESIRDYRRGELQDEASWN